MSSDPERPPKLVDDRLAVALSHETRECALALCAIRPTSTKEVADALGIEVNTAWHHVDKLRELGCLEEVDTRRRGGATERFYVSTSAFYFDSDAWSALPRPQRLATTMKVLRLIAGDVDEAVRADTVAATDRHLSRTVIDLDDEGQKEAYAVLAEALERLLAVRESCVARRDAAGGGTTRASFALMQFDLPSQRDAEV
ncbi:MAG TPA: winged helix-turn-helix domain-containing protein [Solirubrobacterales bacterium]|nr:winged helix-turn-helix domain-containing protein [Solirubrobacterales bacterium]